MKKILIISSASSHTLKFINMMNDNYKVFIITNHKEIFEKSNLKKIYIWKKNLFKNIFFSLKIIKDINPDLIHIQQANKLAFFYTFLLHRNYKILLTVWGSDVLIFPYQNIFNKFMSKYSLNNVHYLSSINSIGIASVIKCLTNFNKDIKMINFGISKYIEFENNFENKENIIYSPRSHKTLYNIEKIIYSFGNFIKKESNWKLYLSGIEDKENTPKYKELVKTLKLENNVVFLGLISQEENARMMKKSKIVISIPFSDGRPISVMEAIASNCILIVSDILANKELIENGLNGIVVDHKKVFDISLYKNIDINLQTKYNKVISKNYNYDYAKKEFLEILEGILIDDNNNR